MMDRIRGYARKGQELWRLGSMDPAEAWLGLTSHLAERPEREKPHYQEVPYVVTEDWEQKLHQMLGLAWPCATRAQFWPLWEEVLKPFRAGNVAIGRGAFDGWGDGEPAMVRAAWCLVRHLKPAKIVETGVARGFTSRMILEALEINGTGDLWSVDLPPPMRPDLHAQIGRAVRGELKHRWTYVKGTSRRHLPGLLKEIGPIDLFIHDSAHSEYNTSFELAQAWRALKPGGVVMADDIDYGSAFLDFASATPGNPHLICHAEPLAPDEIRFDRVGLFGIARKEEISAEKKVHKMTAGR